MSAKQGKTSASLLKTAASALLALFTGAGCYETYEPDPVGALTVPFAISYNGTTCETAGVEHVVALLDDGEYRAEVECGTYEVLFDGVAAGTYDLALFGLNADGIAVLDSLADGPAAVTVAAYTETVTSEPLVLKQAPVLLEARWDLDFGSCASRGIRYFEAKVFDSNDRVIYKEIISCQTPGSGPGEFRTYPDPKRDLTEPDIARIEVQPLKNKVKPLGDAYRLTFEDLAVPGPGESIYLSFKCLEDGCFLPSGSCKI